MDYKKLRDIVESKEIKPTIINEDSNFVVVTYWWGRNNLNNNTARPCVSYYEDFFKICSKYLPFPRVSDSK